MKKCINCGNQLDDNVKFCMVCGAKQPGADRQMENDNGGEKKGGYKTALIISIVAAVVLMVAFISFAFIYLNKNSNNLHKFFSGNNDDTDGVEAYLEAEADDDNEEPSTEKNDVELNDDDAVAQGEENDDSDEECILPVPSADSEKIYVYSWNEEAGAKLVYFYEKYPELENLVEYINLNMNGVSDEYKSAIETHLNQGSSDEKYASIFVADDSVVKDFVSSDCVISVYDVGFTDDMLENMYSYTIDMGTVDEELKALTWQACPGCLCYRSDIAEEVLGVTSPDEMQALVSDWDGLWNVAELMKDAGYYMFSGTDDLEYACIDQNKTPWVTDSTLYIGEGAQMYLEYAKKAYDNGYTKNSMTWSSEWRENMSSDVFCYFGCTWFVYWVLDYEAGSATGNWKICEGPDAYHWGGSYLAIGKDTPNKELAALVAYTLCCDTDVMTSVMENEYEFMNNKAAIDRAIDEDIGKCASLGNQNPLEVWSEVALDIDLSAVTLYDYTMTEFLYDAVTEYYTGGLPSYEAAIEYIKEQVSSYYPDIIVN